MNNEELEQLARQALAEGDEEAALQAVTPAAEASGSARLWQFAGLLQRSLDEHEKAFEAFTTAARLAPDDASIAHGRARVALEAGLDAVALFERARQLDPASGPVLLGWAAAKFAAGRGREAETQLAAAVRRAPLWLEGHTHLAQLRALLGERDLATTSIEQALNDHPANEDLWATLFNLAIDANDFAGLDEYLARARAAGCGEPLTGPFEPIAAAEQGHMARADLLFDRLSSGVRRTIALWEVRHLIRAGRIPAAVALTDLELAGPRGSEFWPYASIAWRLAKDRRSDWLEADESLVSTFDLSRDLPELDALVALLRSLHVANSEYLDQSVRGGTQTDGPLLSRIDPEIRAVRRAIVGAVETHVRRLPGPDPRHPLLKEQRGRRIRFAGSWSVRLTDKGFHANHVHPQGWISSALYVALPARASVQEIPKAGWLKLGEPPPELGLDMGASRLIEPEIGKLVLFPSWMWHGTVPFSEGERLTIAFDVKRPIGPPLLHN